MARGRPALAGSFRLDPSAPHASAAATCSSFATIASVDRWLHWITSGSRLLKLPEQRIRYSSTDAAACRLKMPTIRIGARGFWEVWRGPEHGGHLARLKCAGVSGERRPLPKGVWTESPREGVITSAQAYLGRQGQISPAAIPIDPWAGPEPGPPIVVIVPIPIAIGSEHPDPSRPDPGIVPGRPMDHVRRISARSGRGMDECRRPRPHDVPRRALRPATGSDRGASRSSPRLPR